MNRLAGNLQRALTLFRISENALAEATGVPQSTINRIASGATTDPREATLARLADYFGLTTHTLRTATSGALDKAISEQLALQKAPASKPLRGFAVREWETEYDLEDGDEMVPVYDVKIGAGASGVIPEYVETKRRLPFRKEYLRRRKAKVEDCKVFQVLGDSMAKLLNEGDLVLVNTADHKIVEGGIYAILVGDDFQVKYLRKNIAGEVVIESENPAHKPETVPGELSHRLIIIGRVISRSGDM